MEELYQGIIFGVAEDLNAARYQVRQRLLLLGYWQARGALNYMVHHDGTGRYISMRFMNVCGVMLQFYGVHMMYWKILNCFFMDTIYEVNRHMWDAGFPAMTEGIE